MLVSTTATPSTIVRELAFSGTQSLGGDIDTTTHTELYATAAELSLIYKYTLLEPVTNDVSVEVVNDELEAALGVELDTSVQIRRLSMRLDVVTSYAQACEIAWRWLDRLDQYRNVVDVGIIGNPALQKADMVRIVDPVTLIADDFMVDTYRSSLSGDGTYLGILSLVPWTSSYGGPGTSDLFNPGIDDPATLASFMADGDGGDAINWQGVLSNQTGGPPGSTHYYFKAGSNPFKMVTRGGLAEGDTVTITGYTRNETGDLFLSFYTDPVGSSVSLDEISTLTLASVNNGSIWTYFEVSGPVPAGTVSWALSNVGGSVDFDSIVVVKS